MGAVRTARASSQTWVSIPVPSLLPTYAGGMSDSHFRRPGTGAERSVEPGPVLAPIVETERRPHHSQVHDTMPAASRTDTPPGPSTRRRPGAGALVAVGITGLLVGAMIAAGLSLLYFRDPEPLPITLEVFPRYVLGLQREDMAARDAGAIDAVEQYEAEFSNQADLYRFVHGGDGASVNYGQMFALTIVNGYQSLPVPSNAVGDSPVLVSLQSATVSCIFHPDVGLYDSAVLGTPQDLTATGLTDCVLNDRDRNFSLRLTSRVPGDARRTSTDFAGVLDSTHAGLVSQK